MPTALVILAEGAEDMETSISVNILRRAEIEVTIAGLAGMAPVKCSKGIVMSPDASLKDMLDQQFDVIVCPGGLGGAKAMADSEMVGIFLKKQEERNAYIAAICAAPTAIRSHKIYTGHKITSYPCFKELFESNDDYTYVEEKVCVDRKLITSRGPATTFDFALRIVSLLLDGVKAKAIADTMLYEM